MEVPNFYAGGSVDRAAHRREDAAWLGERLVDASTRILPIFGGRQLVEGDPDVRIAWATPGELPRERLVPDAAVYLGERDGSQLFAIDLDGSDDAPALQRGTRRFEDLRTVGPLLPREDGALLAFARGVALWHERHRHCGRCGARTRPRSAGHALACTADACGAVHHPRTDPAVIMLVHDGADRCVLAASHRHPEGMHSVLAGFVEPGESLEEAVRREVLEEVGVRVGDVEYRSSQPWPFPGSLMIGFRAHALTAELRADPSEIRVARWLSRDDIRREGAATGGLRLPRPDSIARRLVEEWIAEG